MTNEDWAERRRKDMQEDYEGRGFMSLVFGCPFFLAIAVFALSRPFLFAFGYSLLISALIMAGTLVAAIAVIREQRRKSVSIREILLRDWPAKAIVV